MDYTSRVVLVTGGVGGIGEAIVRRYLAEGASVGIVDINQQQGQRLADTLAAQGHKVCFAGADVADFQACESAAASIQNQLGPIDTLINNAGISPKHQGQPSPIHKMAPEEWHRVTDVNLHSAFNFVRILSPAMIASGFGRIVSTSSVAGKAYLDFVGAHYSTTKAALIGFT